MTLDYPRNITKIMEPHNFMTYDMCRDPKVSVNKFIHTSFGIHFPGPGKPSRMQNYKREIIKFNKIQIEREGRTRIMQNLGK